MEMVPGSFKITWGGSVPSPLSYKKLVFSGGEIQIQLVDPFRSIEAQTSEICIHANLTDSNKIMELYMLAAAMADTDVNNTVLICPYWPYARQDRIMNYGECLATRAMAKMVNAMGFKRVEVWDIHSDVSLALIDRVVNYPPQTFVQRIPTDLRNCILVSPDAGASKKIEAVAKAKNLPWIQASKKRNTSDGTITGTEVYSSPVGDKDFLIVDDICDGGRTFVELAKVLRPLTTGKIYLYVTHGIFSKGVEALAGIDHIYCANVFPNVEPHIKLTELNLQYP